jgi:GTP-binding protein
MFVDKVKVNVQAGDGGSGIVSFRHEIYVDRGGPDGGDGGDGGDVVLTASNNQNTLAAFRYNKLIKAKDGQSGSKTRKHGRSAEDLIVLVPVGTMVLDENNAPIADLTDDGQTFVIAKGGKGGFGNAHFTSSVRQAPRIAEKGEKGTRGEFIFELKVLADVGLIGLPNAGKSSLLASISNARPEIADYPFTTLIPHLGVVDVAGQSILFADIPGLIEGASVGKGLGDEFLRHVSRCKVLVHLIDINSNDIATDYKTIRQELADYSKEIAKKPEVIALTKIETLSQDLIDMQLQFLKEAIPPKTKVYLISAYAKKGLDDLLYELKKKINIKTRKKVATEPLLPVIRLGEEQSWAVTKVKAGYLIKGAKIEKFANRTDFKSDQGVARLRDIMKKMGIMHQLRKDGINPGDKILIGNPSAGELEY